MSKELKPATTISEQIETLRERGMQVDEQLAWQWLSNVSYYRLSAYCRHVASSESNVSGNYMAG